MKLDLLYFINKKHISLDKFCELNGIGSYEELVVYCNLKNLSIISKETYDANITKKTKIEQKPKVILQNKENNVAKIKKTKNKRGRPRKTSKKEETGDRS